MKKNKRKGQMDNTSEQIIVLSKINQLIDMQIILANKKQELQEEVNKLEEEIKKINNCWQGILFNIGYPHERTKGKNEKLLYYLL